VVILKVEKNREECWEKEIRNVWEGVGNIIKGK
jgi:hypothetical protein